jgi:hypothetical protein
MMPPLARVIFGSAALAALTAAAPCDIYASGGTPCVAAHGLTRALYNSYDGPLYQVTRNLDGSTMEIYPLQARGVANAAAQDDFCTNTTCVISLVYDQTGNNNVLSRGPPGAFDGPYTNGYDDLASAIGAPVTLNGQKAYGIFVSPGTGYRKDQTTNIPTGAAPQGIYAIMDANHFNDNCCFDYGNAETSNTNTGNGHMEAVYLGNCTVWGTGAGDGDYHDTDPDFFLRSVLSSYREVNRLRAMVHQLNMGSSHTMREDGQKGGSSDKYMKYRSMGLLLYQQPSSRSLSAMAQVHSTTSIVVIRFNFT